MQLAGFAGISPPACWNSPALANPGCQPPPGDICVHDLLHGPGDPAGFAVRTNHVGLLDIAMRFYQVTLRVEGPASDVASFQGRHLPGGAFSYNSAAPMPAALDYEMDNFVQDGYDALFGDWQRLAAYWMFKEAAASKGLPFPLESRAQVLACVAALGAHGEQRLDFGRRYQANLEHFGHGHAQGWRRAHWGTEFDAFDVAVENDPGLVIRFTSQGVPARKVLGLYSAMHPDLSLAVAYQEQGSMEAGKLLQFKAGKVVRRT